MTFGMIKTSIKFVTITVIAIIIVFQLIKHFSIHKGWTHQSDLNILIVCGQSCGLSVFSSLLRPVVYVVSTPVGVAKLKLFCWNMLTARVEEKISYNYPWAM